MPQSIGTNAITGTTFNTKIPTLSETADITAALRLYHFGDPNYNLANTDPANLVNPSIAYTLYDLQNDIATLSGSLGIAYSEYAAKGDILTTTGAGSVSTVQPLALGSQGQVLTVDTTLGLGMKWSTPYTQPTIGSTAIPGATTVTTIAGLTLTNPTVNAGSGVVVLPGSNTPAQTADGSIVWDLDSDLLTVGTGSGRKTMVDTDSTQTLTNKTLSNPTITNNLYLFDGNSIIFEGATPDGFETTLSVVDPTADRTITFPNVTGTVVTTGDTSTVTNTMLAGSIANNKLANSSITINGTTISLGGSATVTTDATPTVAGALFGTTSAGVSPFVTAVGYRALVSNTGTSNTAVGWRTMDSNTSGADNTAVGQGALFLNTTGSSNTVIGTDSLSALISGSGNSVVGSSSAKFITGNNNTVLGYQAGASGTNDLTTGFNNTVIGFQASASASNAANEITLGNPSIKRFRIPGIGIDETANWVIMDIMGAY